MESRLISYQLLVSFVVVCCCQPIWAGRVAKGTIAKYNTTANKEENLSTTKANTTSATTTVRPYIPTTILPSDYDVDGRSVFVNNVFVADAEDPLRYTSMRLNDSLQNQIQMLVSNSSDHLKDYDSVSSQIKKVVTEIHKDSAKPPIGYEILQLADSEEEEYAFDSDCISENCESYHSSNYKTQGNTNAKKQNQNVDVKIEQNTQPQQQLPIHQYIQSKPLQHYGNINQNSSTSYDKPKPQSLPNYSNIIRKTASNSQILTQNSKPYTKQQIKSNDNKPEQSFNPATFSATSHDNISNNMEVLGFANNLKPPFMPNFPYGNPHSETSSPFSTTFGNNKKFTTVSSSTQYVSTPFVDLVFKYSIGMSKHVNSKVGNNLVE